MILYIWSVFSISFDSTYMPFRVWFFFFNITFLFLYSYRHEFYKKKQMLFLGLGYFTFFFFHQIFSCVMGVLVCIVQKYPIFF